MMYDCSKAGGCYRCSGKRLVACCRKQFGGVQCRRWTQNRQLSPHHEDLWEERGLFLATVLSVACGEVGFPNVYENNQQDALYRLIYCSKSALHVSSDVFAHHQEHLTVFTVSGSVHPSFCRNNYESNQQDALYRLIYYSKSALHVSGDVFAHHQEHLTVFTVSGSVHPSCCRMVSRML